jgi:organic radical activating enzyme
VIFEIDPAQAASRILNYGCARTVITGGEPLLQEADFLEMMALIRSLDPTQRFEVETNGTRIPSPAFHEAVDQFNVSPKLANSGMKESLRLHAEALDFFANSSKAWFKFVVSSPSDLEEIAALIDRHSIKRETVLLMPEGRTAAEMDQHARWVADVCRDAGYRYCDRLHIRLWGDKRGV